MTQEEVVACVIEALVAAGMRYMVVGSLASNIHGQPRMTQDADIVIDGDRSALERLVSELDGPFYVSADAARDALAHRDMFNAIHLDTGFKVDLIVRKDRPFSIEELARGEEVAIAGRMARVATAEDTVLSKLDWARRGNSERQFDDAAAIVEVQGDGLDAVYLHRWAAELGVADLLQRALDGEPFRDSAT